MNQFVGKRLKKARQNKGFTQVQVKKLTNIHNKTLSGYENGVSEPDYETLMMLADLYVVSVDYLLGRTDDPTPPNYTQEPDYEKQVLAASNLGEAGIIIANLHASDKIDDDAFLRLHKKAYKHFGLPPVKGAEDAAHTKHKGPGSGVFDKDNNGKGND